jgi:hypothetical protein
MPLLSLGFQALYMAMATLTALHSQGRDMRSVRVTSPLNRYSAWNRKKTTLFSGHYLRKRSTLDIGLWVISVYFNISNILLKSGTFLLGHPVY